MKQKVMWLGPNGFTPGVGLTSQGNLVEIDESQVEKLLSEGKIQLNFETTIKTKKGKKQTKTEVE